MEDKTTTREKPEIKHREARILRRPSIWVLKGVVKTLPVSQPRNRGLAWGQQMTRKDSVAIVSKPYH